MSHSTLHTTLHYGPKFFIQPLFLDVDLPLKTRGRIKGGMAILASIKGCNYTPVFQRFIGRQSGSQ